MPSPLFTHVHLGRVRDASRKPAAHHPLHARQSSSGPRARRGALGGRRDERLARDQIGRTTDLQRISLAPRLMRIIDGTPFPQPNPIKLTLADLASLGASLGDSAAVNMINSGSALIHVAHRHHAAAGARHRDADARRAVWRTRCFSPDESSRPRKGRPARRWSSSRIASRATSPRGVSRRPSSATPCSFRGSRGRWSGC